jgi:hypothetical protein
VQGGQQDVSIEIKHQRAISRRWTRYRP